MKTRLATRRCTYTFIGVSTLAMLAACSALGDGGCTDIGASSSFKFNFTSLAAQPSDIWTVRACLGTICEERTKSAKRFHGYYDMRNRPTTGDPVMATMTIVDQDEHVAFDGSAEVTPQTFQPNGAGCSPTSWVAEVKTQGRNTLVAVHVPLG